ncbi:sensor histidine kinase [Dactylosporangium sp. NPDC051541]|uniref:sensor histidine kinase n=1 Tax=Dactylosporangium sp. NPDC051541 TaxID=3363977 RepID=UPI0037BB3CA0
MTPDRPPRAAAAIVAVTIGALTAASLVPTHDPLDLATGGLAVAGVVLALYRPVAGGLALAVLAALSPVATPAATSAVFTAARRRPLRDAAVVALASVAGHAVQGFWRPYPGLAYGWWLLLMAMAHAALFGWGVWLRTRHDLLLSLRERAWRAEAEQGRRVSEARLAERTLIAREMHDVLAHRLSLLAMYAGALEYRPDAPPERLTEAAGVLRQGVHQALDELREVIAVLRHDEAGAVHSLPEVPRLVREAVAAGQRVRLDYPDGAEVPPTVGRTAYRVVQEALTNARKHAAGQPVTITLEIDGGRLVLDVRNPVTPDLPDLSGSGVGLIGLTERVGLAGGTLEHAVTATGEFRLRAELPCPTP